MEEATPLPKIGLSPSQFCMARRLRTTLPIARSLLKFEAYNRNEVKRRMKNCKEKPKYYHDRHGVKKLPTLQPGDHVTIKPEPGSKEWRAATVVQHHTSPRPYIVDTGDRRLRHNRVALRTDTPKSHTGYRGHHCTPILEPDL